MEEGLSQSNEVVRRGLGGVRDLCNSIDHGAPSPSDENQNRLQGEEGGDERLQEGRKLHQQDSVNNNEETDNDYRACLRLPDTQSRVSPTTNAPHSRDTGGLPESCASVYPEAFTPSPLEESPEGAPLAVLGHGPGLSSSSLVASLLELQDHYDHPRLPQCLHQIAEAYFLEEDYERAFQFIQLERLYHERLLSNLTALQDQWESRWKAGRQRDHASRARVCTDLGSEHLETLRQICKTHQRPSFCAEKRPVVEAEQNSSLSCWRWTEEQRPDGSSLPCSADSGTESPRLMEEQQGAEEAPPAQGTGDTTAQGAPEKDASTLNHQRAPLCNSYSSPPLVATPTPAAPGSHVPDETAHVGGDEEGLTGHAGPHTDAGLGVLHGDLLIDSTSQEGADPTPLPSESLSPGKGLHTEGNSMDPGQFEMGQDGTETGERGGIEEIGKREAGQDLSQGGCVSNLNSAELETLEGEETGKGAEDGQEAVNTNGHEDVREGEAEEEDSLGVEVVGAATDGLDDLAKRIQVEEITPAAGLVSILKRRASLEGAAPRPPAPPKQVPKRKVRFREPDDVVDQDEVGGDSWLLLLLLCMATVVISVGGTALYCTLGNAQSSVCTDFSHNVDFYFSQVQRGIEELQHWLSPGS